MTETLSTTPPKPNPNNQPNPKTLPKLKSPKTPENSTSTSKTSMMKPENLKKKQATPQNH
nr:MAG TPA: hypothetical protein [Caudoviricetes sp.]